MYSQLYNNIQEETQLIGLEYKNIMDVLSNSLSFTLMLVIVAFPAIPL
jgi:hypothetical protein